jgi:lipoprotein-releasing system ATP-binding protein
MTRILPGPIPVTLVKDIDLAFQPGEFAAVTGPSGSGKSSLLYLLGLLDKPSSGEVLVAGRPTGDLSGDELSDMRLSGFGFVFQFHFLLPEFDARDNVMIPMRKLGRRSEKEMGARADELLAALELSEHAWKRPDQLSGGQRQRVAIARALANDPAVLLADEPTGNLDTRTAHTVFDIFAKLAHEQRRTVVVVTHDPDLAAMADRRVHIVDGRIVD